MPHLKGRSIGACRRPSHVQFGAIPVEDTHGSCRIGERLIRGQENDLVASIPIEVTDLKVLDRTECVEARGKVGMEFHP